MEKLELCVGNVCGTSSMADKDGSPLQEVIRQHSMKLEINYVASMISQKNIVLALRRLQKTKQVSLQPGFRIYSHSIFMYSCNCF